MITFPNLFTEGAARRKRINKVANPNEAPIVTKRPHVEPKPNNARSPFEISSARIIPKISVSTEKSCTYLINFGNTFKTSSPFV